MADDGNDVRIEVTEGGPLVVYNLKTLKGKDGSELETKDPVTALCRCGASKDKPYCDGSHRDINFEG